jgi:hypothetical protein
MAQGARHGTVHPCLVHSKAPDLSPSSTSTTKSASSAAGGPSEVDGKDARIDASEAGYRGERGRSAARPRESTRPMWEAVVRRSAARRHDSMNLRRVACLGFIANRTSWAWFFVQALIEF